MSGYTMNPTGRFSDRVNNYVKYRPGYPEQVIQLLMDQVGMSPGSIVADIGSGTGIFTTLLLPHVSRVYALEPNREMRQAAEESLRGRKGFVSLEGSAETTGLPNASIDLITAAQAFHWFEPVKTRAEFQRILKPNGKVVFIWNDRKTDSTPFLRAYEELIGRFGTDYKQVNHRNIVESTAVERFFAPGLAKRREFENFQEFDLEGLKGRLLSSSYMPAESNSQFAPMLDELSKLFEKFHTGGKVRLEYRTQIFWGELP